MKTIKITETRKDANGLKTTVSINTEDINVARKLLSDVIDDNCKKEERNNTYNKSKSNKPLLNVKTQSNINNNKSKLSIKEKEIINKFFQSKKSGSDSIYIFDFNVRRPNNPEFWKELSKLGEVEKDSLKYGVKFKN